MSSGQHHQLADVDAVCTFAALPLASLHVRGHGQQAGADARPQGLRTCLDLLGTISCAVPRARHQSRVRCARQHLLCVPGDIDQWHQPRIALRRVLILRYRAQTLVHALSTYGVWQKSI